MGKKEAEQLSPKSPEQAVTAVIEQYRGPGQKVSAPAVEKASISIKEEPAPQRKLTGSREDNIKKVMGEKPGQTESEKPQPKEPAKPEAEEEAETKGPVPGLAPNPEDAEELEKTDASSVPGAIEAQEAVNRDLPQSRE